MAYTSNRNPEVRISLRLDMPETKVLDQLSERTGVKAQSIGRAIMMHALTQHAVPDWIRVELDKLDPSRANGTHQMVA